MAMTSGKADPMKLYMGGKLKITGDLMASQKLDFLKKIDPKLAQEAIQKKRGAAPAPSAGPATAAKASETAAPAPKVDGKAPAILKALGERLAKNPGLAKEVGALLQLDVTNPEGHWVSTSRARARCARARTPPRRPDCGSTTRTSSPSRRTPPTCATSTSAVSSGSTATSPRPTSSASSKTSDPRLPQPRETVIAMTRRVNVIGVGMTKFAKPGQSEDYHVMASKAAHAALKDANVPYDSVEQAYAGYVYGDSTCGQRAMYEVGLTGIPVFNVNNNCSTGSTALMLGKQAVEGGLVECVLVVGFEKMEKGALGSKFTDRENPAVETREGDAGRAGLRPGPTTAQMFGGAGREYRWRYGTKKETFGKISEKARKHAANNPYAVFNTPLTLDEIMASEEVFDPLTRYQCCPPTCGAAAAVLCSDDFARKHGITSPVWIAGQAMTTDYASSFEKSLIKMVATT